MAVFMEQLLGFPMNKKFFLAKSASIETRNRVLENYACIIFHDYESKSSVRRVPSPLLEIEQERIKNLLLSEKSVTYEDEIKSCIQSQEFTEEEYAENVNRIHKEIFPKYQEYILSRNKKLEKFFNAEFETVSDMFFSGNRIEIRIKELESTTLFFDRKKSSLSAIVDGHNYLLNYDLKYKRNQKLQEILKHKL